MNGERITAQAIAARAPQRAAQGVIACTDFADAICEVAEPAWQVVAHHIAPDLYCEIFGTLPPSEFLLESWIEDQAVASSDYFLSGVTGEPVHELNDGIIDKIDLDCLIHVLCDRNATPEPSTDISDELNDAIKTTDLAAVWDPSFGDARAAEAKKAAKGRSQKPNANPCPPPTHHLNHTIYAPGTVLPPPTFRRDLVSYRISDDAPQPDRLRYAITGDCIAVEVVGADGTTPVRTLDVAYARLPVTPVPTPEGGMLALNGRMVASLPVHAVMTFDGPNGQGPGSDSALDMVEITWDAAGKGPKADPYTVMIETFVSPESPSGEKLNHQTALDLDGDGVAETLTVHTRTDYHLVNRSTPDAAGQSTHPTGWEQDTNDADKTKPHARIRIHHSSTGDAPKG
jgi:hypothetical protein